MPEEIEVELPEVAEEPEIEIVDDTPEELKQPERRTENKAPDLSEEEEKQLGPRAQKRIARLTYEMREAQRKMHEAEQQKVAALKLAQATLAHQNALAAQYNQIQDGWKNEALRSREAAQEKVKYELRQAKDAGDSEREALLIQQMSDLAAQKAQVANWNPTPLQPVDIPTIPEIPQPAPAQQQPQLDEVTLDWVRRNQWVTQQNNPEAMAALQYAQQLQNQLQVQGYDPYDRSCYDAIDEKLRQRFPDVVGTAKKTSAPVGKAPVLANSNRVNTTANGKRVIRLSASEAAVADGLGLTHREYAEQLMKGGY